MPYKNEDYRLLVENLGAEYYVYRHDRNGVFTYLSPSVTQMLGYTQAEFLKHYSNFLTDNPVNAKVERFTELTLKGERQRPYLVEVRHKDGSARWLEVTEHALLDPAGKIAGVEGLAHDITARRKVEAARDEALNRLKAIADHVPGLIYQYRLRPDGSQNIPYANGAIRELFQVTVEEAREDASALFEAIHPDDREAFGASIQKSAREMSPWSFDFRTTAGDGTTRWLRGHSTPSREKDGSILWHGFVSDVTEQKRAEDALRESHMLLDGIINAISTRIFWKNRDLTYLGCNKAFAEDAGFADENDVVGKDDYKMGWREQADLYRADDRAVIESGKAKLLIEEPQTTPDGKTITLLTNKIPLRNTRGEVIGVLGTYSDITAYKRAEAAQVGLQKLESLGVLAGGIAHDFNNILTAIMGNISLLESKLTPGSEEMEIVKEALTACGTARGLSNQLLTFAKGGAPVVAPADLRSVITHAAVFAARGTNARCVFDFCDAPMTANVDTGQITQVIQNLVINATQAMPQGGDIIFRASAVTLEASMEPFRAAGRYIRVTVEDHGAGIAPALLSKIFDPYFSTKGVGRGLGLAMCHSIMTKHGGNISAALKPGSGALFTLYFPAADAAVPGEQERTALTVGSGKVLIMDDEVSLAKILKRIIERLGYQVEAVRDGQAALDAYQKAMKEGRPFAAVIMDLTVAGGMGGKETIGKLLALDPEAKAVVSSGYANDPVMAEHAAHGFAGVLIKPYNAAQVSEALRRVLTP